MKINLQSLSLLALLAYIVGCRSVDPTKFPPKARNVSRPLTNTWHSIRITPKPNTTNITTWDKVNPIWWCRNLDHMEAPDWHRPGKNFRNLTWFTRNPFNNFTFYVIGIADKEHVRSGLYPESIWNPHGGWNYSVAEYKCLRLPMISYRGKKIDFYFGWRAGGNFGIKFNIKKKPSK